MEVGASVDLSGVAGAPWVCACSTDAARREAAKDSHSGDAKLLVFMILGDPMTFVRDRTRIFSPARLKALMRTVRGRSLPNLRDDFTRV